MLLTLSITRLSFSKMWQTILSGKVWQGEIRNRAKNGQYYWVDTTITPRLDEHGQPKKFIAIRHDITKRKELERQKDEFIGIASHELKTPVTSLKGYTQILHTRFIKQGNHDAAAFMAKMDGQINKLNSLIQDLLDVTKIQTGKLQFHIETFDVNLLASEVIESLQLTTDRHTLSLQGKVKKNITGDRERIGQVLTNLLSNAIKYSPYDSQIIVSLSATKAQAKICVRDFGVGIALDKQPLIFKRFYRVTGAKQDTFPGLGLGLFISAQLIKRHHGQIWVESTQGKGSLFCFTLPFNGLAIKNQPNKLAEVELMHD